MYYMLHALCIPDALRAGSNMVIRRLIISDGMCLQICKIVVFGAFVVDAIAGEAQGSLYTGNQLGQLSCSYSCTNQSHVRAYLYRSHSLLAPYPYQNLEAIMAMLHRGPHWVYIGNGEWQGQPVAFVYY